MPIDPGHRVQTWVRRKVGVRSPVRLAVRFGMDPADPYGLTPGQRAAIGLLTGEIGLGRGRLKFSWDRTDNIS